MERRPVPTLVIRSGESNLLLPSTIAQMQQNNPLARVVELPGIGHAPWLASNEQIGHGDVLNAFLRGPCGLGKRIVSEDACAESAKYFGGDPADLASADDAHGLAMKIESDEAGESKVVFADAIVGAVDFAIQSEQQSNRVFGDGIRRVGRNAHHGNAGRLRGFEVDIVEAGAAKGDELHAVLAKAADRLGVDSIIDEDANATGAFGGADSFAAQAEFVEEPLDLLVRLQVLPVVGLGIENGNAHDLFLENYFVGLGFGVDRVARLEIAAEDPLGERIEQEFLNGALKRAGAELRIVPLAREELFRGFFDREQIALL